MFRRLFDVLFAIFAGLVALPVLVLLGVIVRITLGSHVIFSQERAGIRRQPFRMIKLRSMSTATDRDGKLLSDGERTGRFGRFLRRSRLDELPELWNVLMGT